MSAMNAFIGKIIASPYAGIMRLRRWAYRRGIMKSYSVDAPVICIGNITVGGTGKTPMVAWVVESLKEAGRKPAILIRGYKAVGGRSDEAELLKRSTGAPVIVNPDRLAGAQKAIADGADVLVMDDGFQHLRLRRDLDIVLIDATRPFNGEMCLPVGRLREPLTALRDTHVIVITRSDTVPAEILNNLRKRLAHLAPQASIHTAVHKPVKLIDEKGVELPPDALYGRKVCAFCGIGNPEGFFATLTEIGARIAEKVVFGDHISYGPSEIESITSAVDSSGAETVVTTAKDRIKIDNPASLPRPLWTLEVQMRMAEGEQSLVDMLYQTLQV
ncbi:MAG: tetraacyldisaccharide 4'-kinase [Planctomycetota bacterium]|nr:tetraacyldisaccharide 4'-kinase [Planctomycetota bacterium]